MTSTCRIINYCSIESSTGKGITYKSGISNDLDDYPIYEKFPNLVKASNICASHANKSYTLPGIKSVNIFSLEIFSCSVHFLKNCTEFHLMLGVSTIINWL